MSTRYYSTARNEILPWLPEKVGRMLDVGCGEGATTLAVKAARDVEWAGGIEYVDAVADRAAPHFDRVWRGDAAQVDLEGEIGRASLDLVLCLDVLEHMPDPWTMVGRLSAFLRPGGRLVVSVPNVRNWKFLWRLATRGDFIYRDSGLLDRTHLRFFVRSTAIELATCGGLVLMTARPAQTWHIRDARRILSLITLGRSEEFTAKQWLVVAQAV